MPAVTVPDLGGLPRIPRPDPTGPGFKKIIIKPNIVGDLHWVESNYDSVHGRIDSNWRRRGQPPRRLIERRAASWLI